MRVHELLTPCVLFTGLVLLPSQRTDAQIWKHVRDRVAGEVVGRIAERGAQPDSGTIAVGETPSAAVLDSALATGRLVLTQLHLVAGGAASADAERQLAVVAAALDRHGRERFRLVAHVAPTSDSAADHVAATAYAQIVRAMLVAAGVASDRLVLADGAGPLPASAAGALAALTGGATAPNDTATHDGARQIATAAAEELIPGAKLVKLGVRALASRRAAQARADSNAARRLVRLELVRAE